MLDLILSLSFSGNITSPVPLIACHLALFIISFGINLLKLQHKINSGLVLSKKLINFKLLKSFNVKYGILFFFAIFWTDCEFSYGLEKTKPPGGRKLNFVNNKDVQKYHNKKTKENQKVDSVANIKRQIWFKSKKNIEKKMDVKKNKNSSIE